MSRLQWDRLGPVSIQTIDLSSLLALFTLPGNESAQQRVTGYSRPIPKIYLLRFDRLTLSEFESSTESLAKLQASASVFGNKLFKLLPNIEQAIDANAKQLISFGGIWSNHIHALAAAGAYYGIPTVGIIRSQRLAPLPPTLQEAQTMGMRLHFVSRIDYRELQQLSMRQQLISLVGEGWVLPMGGSNPAGLEGAHQMGKLLVKSLPDDISDIWIASATGGTAAGVIAALDQYFVDQITTDSKATITSPKVAVVSVLKHAQLKQDIEAHLQTLTQQTPNQSEKIGTVSQRWRLISDGHRGGYARVDKELEVFLHTLESCLGEPVDHVYMAKVFFSLCEELSRSLGRDYDRDRDDDSHNDDDNDCEETLSLKPGAIAIVHTGGQQGRRGWKPKVN